MFFRSQQSVSELHDRMPVILAENDWPKWLGEEPASEQELLALLRPYPDGALKTWPVDEMVGNVSEIRICNSARHFPLGSRDNL